jgi:hypothetical protein
VYINPFAESFSLLFFDMHYSHTRKSDIISPARENQCVREEEKNILFALCLYDRYCRHTSNVHPIREILDERDEKWFIE